MQETTTISPDKRSSPLSFLLHRISAPLRIGMQKDTGRVEVEYKQHRLWAESVNELPVYIQNYWNLGLLSDNGATTSLEGVDLVLLQSDKMKETVLWIYPNRNV